MEIKYIPYKDIDRNKWEACIGSALQGSLYASAAYLDGMAVKWDALAAGDYEIVMPLIFKKKYGIKYLYQPAFLPKTGIYSSKPVAQEITKTFITKAFELFKFAEISLDHPLAISQGKKVKVTERNNFIVGLQPAYQTIYSNYDKAFIKSLRRLQKLSLQYKNSENVKEVTDLFIRLYQKKILSLKKKHVEHFKEVSVKMQESNNTIIRKVYSADEKLLCAVILLKFKNRLYNMMSCTTTAGKKAEANYFLYDKIIEEFSGQGLLLDLEGSDIKGIADFYRKMNPANEQYLFVRYNNLPLALRLFKK